MKPSKLQHRVTRTRVKGSKLPEFGWLWRPLWIRRVLVRAQEGQYGRKVRGRFCCVLVLRPAGDFAPSPGRHARWNSRTRHGRSPGRPRLTWSACFAEGLTGAQGELARTRYSARSCQAASQML